MQEFIIEHEHKNVIVAQRQFEQDTATWFAPADAARAEAQQW